MDRLIYSALSGMRASLEHGRVLASNMANASTPGFRAELIDARPVTVAAPQGLEVRAMAQALVRRADMAPGAVMQTGRMLDVAVNGRALIAVQAADGGEAYTRRGDLVVGSNGFLATGEGNLVLGEAGPISVPPDAALTIAPDGTVLAANPDLPELPPEEIGRIRLVSPDGSALAKGLDNLFRVPGGGVLPQDRDATLAPGHLEGSNVAMSEVLVAMIEQQRLFEMRSQIVSTARELDESGAQLLRLG